VEWIREGMQGRWPFRNQRPKHTLDVREHHELGQCPIMKQYPTPNTGADSTLATEAASLMTTILVSCFGAYLGLVKHRFEVL
jgi:hypothetical protein